jgi:transposase
MKAYSTDLRERVVKALEEGKTQAWVAETFQVSLRSVQRWIARYRKTGSVAPTQQRRMVSLIGEAQYPALRALVERLADAQLTEYCGEWESKTGGMVSIKTMSCILLRLGLRRKKRPSVPKNGMRWREPIGERVLKPRTPKLFRPI